MSHRHPSRHQFNRYPLRYDYEAQFSFPQGFRALKTTLHFAGSGDPLSLSPAIPPPPVTASNSAPRQSPMQHSGGQTSQAHSSPAGESPHTTHTYVLKTGYAFVSIQSRAHNGRDTPLMYLGEETTGTVVFPEWHLREVQGIIIVSSETETRLMLSSEQVRRSHTSNGEFRWHFAISPPTMAGSSPGTLPPELASSTLGRPSQRDLGNNQEFQLQVTIHRRGCFTGKISFWVRMGQSIHYISDPSKYLLPQTPPGPLRNLPSPWIENKCPEVIVRGVIFGRREIEVGCRNSYPVNDTIPLHLDMTCEDREALDLFAVPHVIDVRLLKVLTFGKNAAVAAPPFTLRNRESYHITNWVASALWNVDGHTTQESAGRLRIRLNGRLFRDPGAEISHIFSEQGMALMVGGSIVVC
ncbi:hypothetical protein H4582DRAFT_2058272 [Lactarius indigo]|nr:hypothetical protein H4582DRAFT_2058272 [Lactarius indigo]